MLSPFCVTPESAALTGVGAGAGAAVLAGGGGGGGGGGSDDGVLAAPPALMDAVQAPRAGTASAVPRRR